MRPVRRPIFPPPAGTHPRTAWARRSRAEAVPLGILALLFLYPVPCWAGSPIQVGGPAVQGKKVVPFTATWYQRARQSPEAEWVDNGTITETLSRGQEKGRQVLIRKQVSDDRQSGIQVVDTVVVDASALAPLRWSFEQTGKLPANAPARGGVEYSGVQIKGSLSLSSGQSVPIEAESPMPLFDAGILGLILAALPLQEGYEAEIPANYRGRSMYMVRARVLGQRMFRTGSGQTVRAWAVKTDWKTLGTSEDYPDDESGGTYFVVPDPPAGFPMVPKYVNPTFDTEVIVDK